MHLPVLWGNQTLNWVALPPCAQQPLSLHSYHSWVLAVYRASSHVWKEVRYKQRGEKYFPFDLVQVPFEHGYEDILQIIVLRHKPSEFATAAAGPDL